MLRAGTYRMRPDVDREPCMSPEDLALLPLLEAPGSLLELYRRVEGQPGMSFDRFETLCEEWIRAGFLVRADQLEGAEAKPLYPVRALAWPPIFWVVFSGSTLFAASQSSIILHSLLTIPRLDPGDFWTALFWPALALPILRQTFRVQLTRATWSGIRFGVKGLVPALTLDGVTSQGHGVALGSGFLFDLLMICGCSLLLPGQIGEGFGISPYTSLSLLSVSMTLFLIAINPFAKFDFYSILSHWLTPGGDLREESKYHLLRLLHLRRPGARARLYAAYYVATIVFFLFTAAFTAYVIQRVAAVLLSTHPLARAAVVLGLGTLIGWTSYCRLGKPLLRLPGFEAVPKNPAPALPSGPEAKVVARLSPALDRLEGTPLGIKVASTDRRRLFGWGELAPELEILAHPGLEPGELRAWLEAHCPPERFELVPDLQLLDGRVRLPNADRILRETGVDARVLLRRLLVEVTPEDARLCETFAYGWADRETRRLCGALLSETNPFGTGTDQARIDVIRSILERSQPASASLGELWSELESRVTDQAWETGASIRGVPAALLRKHRVLPFLDARLLHDLAPAARATLRTLGFLHPVTGEPQLAHPALLVPIESQGELVGFKARLLSRTVLLDSRPLFVATDWRYQWYFGRGALAGPGEVTENLQRLPVWTSFGREVPRDVYIFEGELKAMAAHDLLGIDTMSASGLSFTTLRSLARWIAKQSSTRFHVCFDRDTPKAARSGPRMDGLPDAEFRALQLAWLARTAGAANDAVLRIVLPEGKDGKLDIDALYSLPAPSRDDLLVNFRQAIVQGESLAVMLDRTPSLGEYLDRVTRASEELYELVLARAEGRADTDWAARAAALTKAHEALKSIAQSLPIRH